MSQTVTANTTATDREQTAKDHLTALFEKEFSAPPVRINLTPWVDIDRNDTKMVELSLTIPGRDVADETEMRARVQRFAEMVRMASPGNGVSRANARGAVASMQFEGTLDDLAALQSASVTPETIRDGDVAANLVFPILKEAFPGLKPGDVRVEEREGHVDINLSASHRFPDRKAARAFTNALESGSNEHILVNLNGAPLATAEPDDSKHVHIEYKGSMDEFLGADWNTVQRSMATAMAVGQRKG